MKRKLRVLPSFHRLVEREYRITYSLRAVFTLQRAVFQDRYCTRPCWLSC